VCKRDLHKHTRTVAIVDRNREAFCCPTCAFAARTQGRAAVRIVELSDYNTHTPLNPESAVIVRDSDHNPCMQQHSMIDHTKHPQQVTYDRCSPSIIAFASRAAAERFQAQHGGKVIAFTELRY
jgi:hypothetical protein